MMSERHHRRDRPSPLVFASRRRGHDRGHVCYTFSGESAAMCSDKIGLVQQCLVLDTELACRMD